MLWIFSSFLLVTLFSNEILSHLISPQYKSIDSIDQLNSHQSAMTTVIWEKSYAMKTKLVFNVMQLNFFKLIINLLVFKSICN